MSCSAKQAQLIDHLQSNGAPILEKENGDPDYSYLDSIKKADEYIKLNYHYYHNREGIGPWTVIEGMHCPKS